MEIRIMVYLKKLRYHCRFFELHRRLCFVPFKIFYKMGNVLEIEPIGNFGNGKIGKSQ